MNHGRALLRPQTDVRWVPVTFFLLACGSRTNLEEFELDATDDVGLRDTGIADRASKDGPILPPVDASGPPTPCGSCSTGLNVAAPPVTNCTQGAQWLALELPLACDQRVLWVKVHATTMSIRMFADDGSGRPGQEILKATPTKPVSGGWSIASANLQLKAGTYWVAMSNPSSCSFAKSGTPAKYWGSFMNDMWEGPYEQPVMIEAGDCDNPN